MNDVNQTKQQKIFLITAKSFHMTFSWTLLWKFHFVFNWPLEFPRSSIPLEIRCLPTTVTCLGWIISGVAHCSWYVLMLYWVDKGQQQETTVLFSSSRAGLSILKMANIGRLTFLLLFSRQEIYEKSTKKERFQCVVTQVVLVKNS